jgi:hypothetical protein
MTLSPISNTSALSSTQGVEGQFHQARAKVLSAVADKLNMSVDQLKSQLSTGKSLTDVAKANNLSQTDLMSTISSALQGANLPAGTDLTAMADRIANHVGGHHRHSDAAASAPLTASPTTSASYTNYLQGTTTDKDL